MQEQRLIELPNVAEIIAIEKLMYGERKEMAQEAFDVLHEVRHAKDDPVVGWKINNLKNLLRGFKRIQEESRFDDTRPAGVLKVKLKEYKGKTAGLRFKTKTAYKGLHVVEHDLGLASVNMVTDNGVAFVIDAIQSLATISNLKWHGSGTGTNAEAQSDSALQTEQGSRVAGTQVEGASANIYKTVATLSYGSSLSIVEHGLFDASTSGTLFDRSKFTAIAVDTSTSIEFTYEWTLNAGG